METRGFVRNIDEFGRITIPKEIRKSMGMRENEPVEMLFTSDGVLIRLPKKDLFEQLYEEIRKAYEIDKSRTLESLINAGILSESEVKKHAKKWSWETLWSS